MPNPNTFDEASAATEQMFANEQFSLTDDLTSDADNAPQTDSEGAAAPTGEAPAVEPTANEAPTAEQNAETAPAAEPAATASAEPAAETVADAVQTAEIAAQVASEKDSQLKQAMAENEDLKRRNEQLQGTIDEMSRKNAENIVEEALKPPTLDINALAFADEETQRAAVAKFSEDMAAFNRKQIMDELSPTLEYAKRGMRDAERAEVVETLSKIPELSGIKEMLPQLDRIIAGNKWLSSEDMPMDEKYINAFAMAKGINSINNPPTPPEVPKEPTPEEMLAMYNNNPAFRELVEKQRLESIKTSQQVPPFSASSGAANAALNIKEKPKTFEEASRRTMEMFGGM